MIEEPAYIDTHPEPRSRMLGKWMSAAMVVGSMVGSGIYLLPTTLAPFGLNLVLAFLLTGFGTMCLAFALARLAARIEGGPFAYVDRAFGEHTAFVTLWCYTFSRVTGSHLPSAGIGPAPHRGGAWIDRRAPPRKPPGRAFGRRAPGGYSPHQARAPHRRARPRRRAVRRRAVARTPDPGP